MVKRIVIFLVFILVLLRLIAYYNYFQGWEVYFFSDNAIYAILAKRFLNGDFLGAVHPFWNPGFPIATIPFYLLSNSWEKAQILTSMFSATALILVMFFFFKRFSLAFALIVAFITAFATGLQKLVIYEGVSEPFYILTLTFSIFLGWLALSSNKIYFYLSTGVFFAFSYLTRTDVVGLFVTFLGFGLNFLFFKGSLKGIRKQIVSVSFHMCLILIAFFLVSLPYIMILSNHLGRFTFSGKYANIGVSSPFKVEGNNSTTWAQDVWSVDFPDYRSHYYDSGRAMKRYTQIIENGSIVYWAKKTISESLQMYSSKTSGNFFVGIGLELAIIGFAAGMLWKKFRTFTLYFTLLWLGEMVWIALFMAPLVRYLSFALPFFFYLQALAIYSLAIFVSRHLTKVFGFKGWINKVLIFITISLFLGVYLLQNVQSVKIFNTPQRIASNVSPKLIGEWIKSQDIKVVATRHEAIGFYGNAKIVYTPIGTPDQIINYLKSWGVEYLIIKPDDAGYDLVRPITSKTFKHPSLTFVKEFNDQTVVWKVDLTDEEKKINKRTLRLYTF